jgi:SNF2 family DNA or RNA helicase
MLGNPGAALFLEPGLGKTSVTLACLKTLLKGKHVNRVLIVAPLRVCYGVWPREIEKWDDFRSLEIAILHGPKKDEALRSKAPICVINPEGLDWLYKSGGWKDFDALVIDESTKFKNRNTKRFNTLTSTVWTRAKWRWILTGTPAPNRLMDLWAQMFIVDAGERLSRFITRFRREYFFEVWNGFAREYTPRPDAPERIKAKIEDVAMYLAAADHLDMPELLTNEIVVDLSDEARDAYRRIARDAFATLRGGAQVSVAQKSAAQMKLRQITGGSVYDDHGGATIVDTAKYDALVDLIDEQNGQPLLVALGFQHEADELRTRIRKEFHFDAPYLGGGISARAGDAIANDWNAGKLPVLLAHPASVAHGLNLQAGGHAVAWFTPTWSLEEYIQFNARVWRQGQTSPTVIIHHLVAADTVDGEVFAALAAKQNVQQSLLNALKKGV